MVSDLVKYLKSLQDAERQVSRALEAVKQNEPAMYKMLLSQERQMATADGLGFTDEEIDRNYMRKEKGGYYIRNTNYESNLVLRDPKTKKEYMTGYRDMTDSLLDALRERTGTKVLGFYISSGKKIDRYTLEKYFPVHSYDGTEKVFDRKKVMAEFRKNKCLVVKHNSAYDEFYLLAGGNMQVSDGQMATPSENAKKSEIKRLFTSTLKENKDSRVVLNKFISQVA